MEYKEELVIQIAVLSKKYPKAWKIYEHIGGTWRKAYELLVNSTTSYTWIRGLDVGIYDVFLDVSKERPRIIIKKKEVKWLDVVENE